MIVGSVIVLLISDPMVAVLNSLGNRIPGLNPFYVSFIFAPLASNASEFIAAYFYAKKKTRKTITISFSTLLGAASMNNTFTLFIFFLIIYLKGLVWEFTAETLAILVVEFAMFLYSMKPVHTLFDALIILTLLPISLGLVAMLKGVGLD